MARLGLFVLLGSFLALALVSCSKSPAGAYLAELRPHEIIYMTLAAAQDRLSGNLTIVTLNGRGIAERKVFALEGLDGKDNFTLTAKEPGLLGDTILLSGKKQNKHLMVTLSAHDGALATLKFAPATNHEINAALDVSEAKLAAEYTRQRELQAKQDELQEKQDKARNEFNRLTSLLSEDIAAIKQTGIPQDIHNINKGLEAEKSGVEKIRQSSNKLKSDAAIKPMSCYQAEQKVRYDFEQGMQYHWEQTFLYAREELARSLDSLRARINNGEKILVKLNFNRENIRHFGEANPPRQSAISAQIAQADAAQTQYIALLANAKNSLSASESEDKESLLSAKELMNEGKKITQEAIQNTRCP